MEGLLSTGPTPSSFTISPEGLIMYKGSRFLVPEVLRPGLLRALHSGHAGVVSMLLRAKECFWWPGLKQAIESVRANCLICHENAPSQPKQPSMGFLRTKYAYEALSMDHFFLKGVEYLAIVDRHSGMLSVHCTAFKGAKELMRILRLHCQRSGIPRVVYSDGSSIFCAHETREFFKRYNIEHVVSSVANPHSNFRSELSVKHLKRILRDIVGASGNLDSDAVTQALLCHANTKCKVLKKSPAELAYGRCLKDFFPRNVSSLLPIPENLMSGEMKDKLQGKIREDGAKRWSEHTRVLPELKIGDFVQVQNLRGRNPLKSDYNGIVVGRSNLNSYAVKINGTDKVTVRNRATLRRILPPVPVHKLESVQAPVLSGPSAVPAESRRQAVPPGIVGRAGLRSGYRPSHNIIVSGDNAAGSGGQKEVDSRELVFRAAAEMDNPGILGVLRQSPRAEPGVRSAPGQRAGPGQAGAESGQSSGQARLRQTASTGQGSEDSGGAVSVDSPGRGGLRQLGGQDRLETGQSGLSGNILVQADGGQGDPGLGLDQTAEVGLPVLHRGSRQKFQITPYQAGDAGME